MYLVMTVWCTYQSEDITQTWRAKYKLSISDMNRAFDFIIHTKYIDIRGQSFSWDGGVHNIEP